MSYPLIIGEFLELVSIPVHSFNEREIADVLKKKLSDLGLSVTEDKVGEIIGGNAGNLIARLPGDPKITPLLLSAHMDRVPNPGVIVPKVLEAENKIVSTGDTILAADDISGVVSILDGIRRIKESSEPHGTVEIVFSVAEEVSLQGAKNLDFSQFVSKMAYVLDSNGHLGTLVNRAPTNYAIDIRIYGESSHAGLEPEKGLNAINVGAQALMGIKEGRLSKVTTANYGMISGGKARNVVCNYLEIKGEARGHDDKELKEYLAEVDKVFYGTGKERGAKVEIDYKVQYEAFHVKEDEEVIRLAFGVMEDMGLKPEILSAGAGNDGNYFNKYGIKSVGLAVGYNNIHTEEEEQSISELVKCGEMVAGLIRATAKTRS